jgi:GR25 family glycosyltransferase involved in LPS biosynthesis
MKLYITHYTPLVERKQHLLKQLAFAGITDYEFIEIYDREQLTHQDITKFSNIRISEASLFLKHYEIFKKNVDATDIIVVLEDDAILVENFKEHLANYLKILSTKKWDVAFTGECCNIHAKNIVQDQFFYESNSSRGTCMYIVNSGVCQKLYNIFNQEPRITLAIDHWFNKIGTKYELKYLYSEPTLVYQGSELGLYKSTIR